MTCAMNLLALLNHSASSDDDCHIYIPSSNDDSAPYWPKQKQPRAPSVQPSAPPLEKAMMDENLLPGRPEIIHGDHVTLLSDMFCEKTGRIACMDCILSEMDQLLVSEMTLHEMDSSERFQYLGAKKFTDFPGNRDDLSIGTPEVLSHSASQRILQIYCAATRRIWNLIHSALNIVDKEDIQYYVPSETERAANFLLTELLQDLENLVSMQLSSSHHKNSECSHRLRILILIFASIFFRIVLDMMEPRDQKLHRVEVRFDNCLKQLKEMSTSASRCSDRVEHSQHAADGVGQHSWERPSLILRSS
ncbi:hypothetical protein OROHE_019479 [Orobanche hederae]